MQWSRREIKKKQGICFNYSHIAELRKKGKSNPEFEFMLNNLTLEDLIALKLELSSKMINYKLSGMKLWNATNVITKQAVLKYAMSVAKTHAGAATLLGMDLNGYLLNLKEYCADEYDKLKEERS